MVRYYLLILIFYSFFSHCQVSKDEFLSEKKQLEKIKEFKTPFKLNFNDTRSLQKNKISIETLENSIKGFYELFKNENTLLNDKNNLKHKEININIDFYNFMESSSKNAILKGMASIEMTGGDYSSINEKFTLSNEKFSSLKFKKISKKNFLKESSFIIDSFSKRFAKNIIEKIVSKIKNEENYLFEVTTIGFAKLNKNLNKKIAEEKAISDALIRASEMAFGTKISNITKIKDFGDVSDEVKSESGSLVLQYTIVENSIKFTTDNYCCLIVKAIIKKQ